jgi:glycosyltransferase involved in cell wall biosynthesis
MRISIVINNYNYRQFVGRAIESALAQTHDDLEVVVVDDGSTDDSLEVIRGFGNRIKLIDQRNGGQGSAYNAGYARATGAVVFFLDADDWLYPQAAARVAAAWREGVSKVQFPLELVDREGQSLGRCVPRSMHDREAMDLLRDFGAYGSPPGSGNAFGAGFLKQVMPMDEGIWRTAADSVPILLAPAYGEVVSLQTALGAYRQHRSAGDGSLLSNNAPSGLWHEFERIAWTKRYVEQSLSALGQRPRVPQFLAPWEARLAALCARFGGAAAPGAAPRPSASRLMRFALHSVWQWPMSGVRFKSMLSIWMVGVWLLPLPLAQRLARMHRASVGAPVVS